MILPSDPPDAEIVVTHDTGEQVALASHPGRLLHHVLLRAFGRVQGEAVRRALANRHPRLPARHQRRFATAVLLVHHARKSGATRPGQALRGSSELHTWRDSNLYLRQRDRQSLMTVKHRAALGLNGIEIEFDEDGKRLALRLRQVETPSPSNAPSPPRFTPTPPTAEACATSSTRTASNPTSLRRSPSTCPTTLGVRTLSVRPHDLADCDRLRDESDSGDGGANRDDDHEQDTNE